MAQHYEVGEGKTLIIRGPANIIVKTGDVPLVGNAGDNVEPPVLISINPDAAVITDPDFTLTATGADFIAESVICLDGTDAATTFISESSLTTPISPALFALRHSWCSLPSRCDTVRISRRYVSHVEKHPPIFDCARQSVSTSP